MKSVLLRYRLSLGFFIGGLIVSGLTTFPLQWEISLLQHLSGGSPPSDTHHITGLQEWIGFVHAGLFETYSRFPFFGYASDWLGFGHFVIAAFFVLPFANPAKYAALLRVGLAACGGVIVVAFVCGAIRGIPLGWQLIDCSFGVIGAIPLLYCLHLTNRLAGAKTKNSD
jgi:hypothetical protein